MRQWGIAMIGIGIFIAMWAMFATKTTVYVPAQAVGSSFIDARETYNLGLLQWQNQLFMTGVASFLAGVMLFAASSVSTPSVDEIPRKDVYSIEHEAGISHETTRQSSERNKLIFAIVAIAMMASAIVWYQTGINRDRETDSAAMVDARP